MKLSRIFFLNLLFAISALGQESQARLHWFQIMVAMGDSTATFTGSSPLAAPQMAALLAGDAPIQLENLREFYLDPKEPKPEQKWHPSDAEAQVFLPPRAVLYIKTLRDDPVIIWNK